MKLEIKKVEDVDNVLITTLYNVYTRPYSYLESLTFIVLDKVLQSFKKIQISIGK